MNIIKLKRMKALAESLKGINPSAAFDLISMLEAIEQPPQVKSSLIQESLPIAIKKVTDLLSQYDWCLAGGLAVIHYVNTRVTYDIDCLVTTEGIESIKSKTEHKKNNFGISIQSCGINVDLIDAKFFPYAEEAIRNSIIQTEFGISIPVMKPEYLILFKIESMRDKDNNDAFALLRLTGIQDKARLLIKKYKPNLVDDLEQAISIADMMV